MNLVKGIFLDPIVSFGGLDVCLLNLIIWVALFFLGKVAIKYLKRAWKKNDWSEKQFTVEGKNIPVFRLIFQLMWLFTIYLGFKSLSINNSQIDLTHLMAYEFIRFDEFYIAIYHLFFAVGLYFAGRILLSLVRIYLVRRLRRLKRTDEGTAYVYFQLVKYILISLGLILLMRSMGVKLSVFMESILFLSVGVALGMQDIFKDFFSGLLLLFESSVKVGDIVEIERQNQPDNFVAKILEINMRTSKVETRDGKMLIITNSHLTFQKVNNWSTGDQITRFMITVEVEFGSDLELVKKILVESAQNHPKVIKNRDVIVRLLDFGHNGYKLDVVFWADKNFFIEIHKSDIRFAIDHAFRQHGIRYPFNQLDVHMVNPQNTSSTSSPEDIA